MGLIKLSISEAETINLSIDDDEMDLSVDDYVGNSYAPQVDVAEIEGGHQVTITSRGPDGSETHVFDVLDGRTGPMGPQGIQGLPGVDGITPTAEVTKVGDTATITITDAKGTTTAQLTDGVDGKDGRDGVDGISPTAKVTQTASGATFTVTDKSGSTTAQVTNGVDGKDGISPTAKVERNADGALVTITDASGITTAQITDGRTGDTGATGPQGPAGEDGVSPTVALAEIDGGHRITITDADGEHSFTVPNYSGEEDAREAAENARVQAEASRASAESARASAETSRASAESLRVAAEQARVSAETSRASAMRQIESDAANAVASTQAAASSAEQAESELRAAAQRGDFDGADGISPTATVTQTADGATITIIDKTGTTTAQVANGIDGSDGKDGLSPTASVVQTASGATITVTDKSGTTTAQVSNGRAGDTGATGPQGPAGADGVSPTASVTQTTSGATITVTDKNGTTTADIANGATGPTGPQGPAGSDGVSPTVATTEISGGHRVAVTDADGTQSFDVLDGPQGKTGADGFSPTVSVSSITGGHEVTITDATGAHSFDVMDSAGGIPYGTVDATSTSTAFTATVEGVTRLANGTTVVLHNGVVTSAENFTININGLGAKKCYNNMTNATQETTIFNVAYTLMFVYSTALDSGNGGWWIYRGYDSDAGMTVLQYGTSTWADFQAAYEANKLVYCMYKISANETRMAFLAYTYPGKAEFQYYRTVGSKSATQQGDEVYIYTLTKNSSWTTTVRQTYTKIVAGTGLTSTYSANTGTLTLNAPPATASTLGGVKVGDGLSVAADGTLALAENGYVTQTDFKTVLDDTWRITVVAADAISAAVIGNAFGEAPEQRMPNGFINAYAIFLAINNRYYLAWMHGAKMELAPLNAEVDAQTQAITLYARGRSSMAYGVAGVDESWTITALPTDVDGVSF